MKNFYRKDWILYEEVANEGGKVSSDLIAMKAKEDDPDKNKHVPFVTELENGYEVKSGKNEFHGMDSDHHIIFIDLYVDDKYHYRQYLNYGASPENPKAVFEVPKGKKVVAMSFCNLHGIWKNEFKK